MIKSQFNMIFGLDFSVSKIFAGGVTTMVPFLSKFFPNVLSKMADTKTNIYCVFDSQILTLFTSSLYIAGLVSSLAASILNTTFGRKNTMLLGGSTFLVGGILSGAAANIAMLIFGRILLGLGIGLTTQVSTFFLRPQMEKNQIF